MEYLSPLFDSAHIGWTMLGIAALIFSFSVLILARMRWIQSRPLSACVVLSVIAHILLFCSACLTRIFDFPRPPGDPGIRIQIVDCSPLEQESPEEWEQVVVEPVPVASLTPLPEAELEEKPPALVPAVPEAPVAEQSPQSIPAEALTAVEMEPPLLPADAEVLEPNESRLVATPDLEVGREKADWKDEESSLSDTMDGPSTPELSIPDRVAGSKPSTTTDSSWKPVETEVTTESSETNDPVKLAKATSDPTKRDDREQGYTVPRRYRGRLAAHRGELLQQRGGSPDTEAAVQRALAWLARVQQRDGRWDASHFGSGQGQFVEGQFRGATGIHADTGISGLALLSFLGAGHTHQVGDHRQHVAAVLGYLISHQGADGNLFGEATHYARMYCHGIAALALSESLAMTGDDRLRAPVERAISFTLRCQHPATGGWRYYPGDSGDTSQFGWQLMAIVSARQAGVQVPPDSMQAMVRYLDSVSHGTYRGLASYRYGQGPSRSMTAEALVCRTLLAAGNSRLENEATAYLLEELPGSARDNYYYWYYATMALSRTDNDAWRAWNKALQRRLLTTQRSAGALAGSWEPSTVWGPTGGRVYTTAMATLCLESYYRYDLTDETSP